ncbi:hypothetical protein AB1Y20_018978 [Prymnesium parvum]|uniref:SMP-30/Gluconolactonase/LRE-like region domain-containing protein n=1 Tax=Prymnesium parvum TaxID=97485 RepID=A0AB34JT13_PRYPA
MSFSLLLPLLAVLQRAAGPLNHVHAADVMVVASGFSWAENMICVAERKGAPAALYVTDNVRGELWRISWDAAQKRYSQTLMEHLSSDFSLLSGLATDVHTGQLFAAGNLNDGGDCVIVEVATDMANTSSLAYQVRAHLPRRCLGGGLAVDENYFYMASEGDFIPFNGKVFRIHRTTGYVETIVKNGIGDDGVWFDPQRGLLYVSECELGRAVVYNASAQAMARTLNPQGYSIFLDDFMVDATGSTLIGADFSGGRVVAFDVQGPDEPPLTILLENVQNPTSVRSGCSEGDTTAGLGKRMLFVSEGGGSSGAQNRRILAFMTPTAVA